jgi:hypothetical protein
MATLVVGGTGMLAGVVRTRIVRGDTVVVMSRDARRFKALAESVGDGYGRLHHVGVDYTDASRWAAAVSRAGTAWGPFGLVIVRMRSDATTAFATLVEALDRGQGAFGPWRLFHIRSSAASRHPVPPPVPDSCCYRQIILGFVLEGTGARWLTHPEIVSHTVTAIDHDWEFSVVGTVEPWDRRPSY